MNRIVVMVLCLGLCSFLAPVHGQIAGAAVSLTCDSSTHTPKDPLGFNNTTVACTVLNPTAYDEVIRIEVDTNGLDPIEPWNLAVGAGQEESVEMNVSGWSTEMIGGSMTISLSAAVLEQNNVPPPNSATDTTSFILDLEHNYVIHGCETLSSASDVYFIQLTIDTHYNESHGVPEDNEIIRGNITIKLNHTAAPVHANNFALLTVMGCYDDTVFHRVIEEFMIQGGDFTHGDGTGGHAASWQGYCNGQASTDPSCGGSDSSAWTIPDEANNGLQHLPCSVSMAKTSADNTGGSQFFIIPQNNNATWLDGVHTVFGTVVEGCDLVTSISEVDVNGSDRPVNDITVEQARVVGAPVVDDDDDAVNDDVDNCPNISNQEQTDMDGDGAGDACDEDLDGDGTNNTDDAFPYDANELGDHDGDGIGNEADADDDNDGMNDTDDAFPLDQNETTDTDMDGIGNNADADDDGDGVADETDNCPYVANADQADADNDGEGTACDGMETETETATVPALGVMGACLAVALAMAGRKGSEKD